MKKVVYIDMDGVIASFDSGVAKLNEHLKGVYRNDLDLVPNIFANLDPVEGAIAAVKRICKKYDVYILSTAPWRNPTAWSDKLVWLQRWFGEDDGTPLYKRLILSHHKNLCKGDYLIDDNPDKNGVSEFEGQVLHFGSEDFPNWDTVLDELNA